MLNKIRSKLTTDGTVVLDEDMVAFTDEELAVLNKEVRGMLYHSVSIGDTYESISLDITRIKIAKDETINNQVIYDLLNKPTIKEMIRSITGLEDYVIDRCQAHIYRPGDYISAHRDKSSCEDYEYVVSIVLDSEYEGGDFVVYRKNGEKNIFKPKANQMLLSSCDFYHEVTPVTSGERRVLLSFIQPVENASTDIRKAAGAQV